MYKLAVDNKQVSQIKPSQGGLSAPLVGAGLGSAMGMLLAKATEPTPTGQDEVEKNRRRLLNAAIYGAALGAGIGVLKEMDVPGMAKSTVEEFKKSVESVKKEPETPTLSRELSKVVGTPGIIAGIPAGVGAHLGLSHLESRKATKMMEETIKSMTNAGIPYVVAGSGIHPKLLEAEFDPSGALIKRKTTLGSPITIEPKRYSKWLPGIAALLTSYIANSLFGSQE